MSTSFLDEFKKLYKEYTRFNNIKIPLCAAETYVSDFVKQGLRSEFEGKYIQGYKKRIIDKDNIGSDYIYRLMELVSGICKEIYNVKYTDCRTLSGMNCFSILAMSLLKNVKKVLITTKDMGGHPSLTKILENYGINYKPIPYDYVNYDIDYTLLNQILRDEDIEFIIICQSDLIKSPDIKKIKLTSNQGIIYDASQTLGLIGAGLLENPLNLVDNLLLIGGTHKTLPGPTCGIIMTNNNDYIEKIDFSISPTYLRNIQPNNIASLFLALIELKEIGIAYQNKIIETSNLLGKLLEEKGLTVRKINRNIYSETHQIFIETSEKTADILYINATKFNITLNKRKSRLLTGIRLGTQEIARYNFNTRDLNKVAELIYLISREFPNENKIRSLCYEISSKKQASYIINDLFME